MIYFLLVNYNSSNLIARFLSSLPDNYNDYARIVVVNNSAEDRGLWDLPLDSVKIIEAKTNLGFGRGCNLGLHWIWSQDAGAIAWLINPDAYFAPETIKQLNPLKQAIAFWQQHSEVSLLGTVVDDDTGQITSAGGTFDPSNGALTVVTRLPEARQDYYLTDWVSGCSMLINLANFQQIPQFCDRYFLYYEDLDFCLRYSQQGHQIAITPLLRIRHDTSSITSRDILQKYRHITQSYLIHIEQHSNPQVMILTQVRMLLNTLRLIVFKPQQGWGKLIGIYEYWQHRISKTDG